MNRADRGPLLLIVAGVLMLLAIVAYLIDDAEDHSRRMEASFERQALDAQTRRTVAEVRAIRDENDRTRRERDRIRDQHEEMLKSLERIEKLLGGGPSLAPACKPPGNLDVPSSDAVRRPAVRADLNGHPL